MERKQVCPKHRSSRKVHHLGPPHKRHRPETTLFYGIIDRYYPEFRAYMSEQGHSLPLHVQKEFDEYLKCGRLEHGFLRVQCSTCHHEWLAAFSCKRRGFCPSCGARRMAESAALLVDEFLPHEPIATQAWEHDKLERLCRYISRPALSEKRFSLTTAGNIRYKLKTPYSDGSTHVIFEPLDFISKLAFLVPKPRVSLTRFARIIPDTHPLRRRAEAVQIHS